MIQNSTKFSFYSNSNFIILKDFIIIVCFEVYNKLVSCVYRDETRFIAGEKLAGKIRKIFPKERFYADGALTPPLPAPLYGTVSLVAAGPHGGTTLNSSDRIGRPFLFLIKTPRCGEIKKFVPAPLDGLVT